MDFHYSKNMRCHVIMYVNSPILNTRVINSKNLINMEKTETLTGPHIFWVKSFGKTTWCPELSTDHYIVSRLVPEVITHGGCFIIRFPATLDVKRFAIKNKKTACAQTKR